MVVDNCPGLEEKVVIPPSQGEVEVTEEMVGVKKTEVVNGVVSPVSVERVFSGT